MAFCRVQGPTTLGGKKFPFLPLLMKQYYSQDQHIHPAQLDLFDYKDLIVLDMCIWNVPLQVHLLRYGMTLENGCYISLNCRPPLDILRALPAGDGLSQD